MSDADGMEPDGRGKLAADLPTRCTMEHDDDATHEPMSKRRKGF
jgi:hypothetical protein